MKNCEIIESIFGEVTLTMTPEGVCGEVSKEEALVAVREDAKQAALNLDLITMHTNMLWYKAILLNYTQVTSETSLEGESLKSYICDIIAEAFDANKLPQVLQKVVKNLDKGLYNAFKNAEI